MRIVLEKMHFNTRNWINWAKDRDYWGVPVKIPRSRDRVWHHYVRGRDSATAAGKYRVH
jgi:hypothetical protein